MLNRINELLRPYTNYFQPVMVLMQKERQGSKTKKSYDKAQTPYRWILAHPNIPKESKTRLTEEYRTLNPVALKRQILNFLDELSASKRPYK